MSKWRLLACFLMLCGAALVAAYAGLELRIREERAGMEAWLRTNAVTSHEGGSYLPGDFLEPAEGSPLGMVSVPRLRLEVAVFAGSESEVLARGAGWIPGTSLPGGRGNAGIAAHRDTVFRPLEGIRIGDEVRWISPGGIFTYRVRWIEIVKPSETRVLDQEGTNSLTLVSCYPFRWVGPAPERFIVRADAVEAGSARRKIAGR